MIRPRGESADMIRPRGDSAERPRGNSTDISRHVSYDYDDPGMGFVEDVVDAPDVPHTMRLGRLVQLPLEDFAYVTEEQLPMVLDPASLNGGNVVDIYQEREEDFSELLTLDVSYIDPFKGHQISETLFVTDLKPHDKPRVCMPLSALKAMRCAIQVLTRKVDNLILTLRSCREDYLKEICHLKSSQAAKDHNAQWFSPHTYEDNFTKEEVRRQLDKGIADAQASIEEKDREIKRLEEKIASQDSKKEEHFDELHDMVSFKKCVSTLPLGQVMFVLKQSVENDPDRQASLHSHLERLLGDRLEREKAKALSHKGSLIPQDDGVLQHYKRLSEELAHKLVDIQVQLEEALRTGSVSLKVEEPGPKKAAAVSQKHRIRSAGVKRDVEWKEVLARMQEQNVLLKADVDATASRLSEVETRLQHSQEEAEFLRGQCDSKDHIIANCRSEVALVQKQGQRKLAEKQGTVAKLPRVRGSEELDASPAKPVLQKAGTRKLQKQNTMLQKKVKTVLRGLSKSSIQEEPLPTDLQGALGGVVSADFKRSAKDKWSRAADTIRCEHFIMKIMTGAKMQGEEQQQSQTTEEQVLFLWTTLGAEWAKSTRSFAVHPAAGIALNQAQNVDLHGLGTSVTQGLAEGYFEKVGEGPEPAWMADDDAQAQHQRWHPEWAAQTAYTWMPEGVHWGQSSASLPMLPEPGSTMTDEQMRSICAFGGAPPGSLLHYVWTPHGVKWARGSDQFGDLPKPKALPIAKSLVTNGELESIRSLGGAPAGCLVRAGMPDEHVERYAWTTKGVQWVQSCSILDVLPETNSSVTVTQMQAVNTVSDVPAGCFVHLDERVDANYDWTQAGVDWVQSRGALVLLPEAGFPATKLHLDVLRALGGCPSGCLVKSVDDKKASKSLLWTEDGSSWASLSRSFVMRPIPGTMVTASEYDTIRGLGGCPQGCVVPAGNAQGEVNWQEDFLQETVAGRALHHEERGVVSETLENLTPTSEARRQDSKQKLRSKLSVESKDEHPASRESSKQVACLAAQGDLDRKAHTACAMEDAASQTMIGFMAESPAWCCLVDLHGDWQEGVRHGILLPGVVAGGHCMGTCKDEVDAVQAYVCGGEIGNFVLWPQPLTGDFIIETRIKILDLGLSAAAFVFGSGSQMDLIGVDGRGKSMYMEGSHWDYVDTGVATPFGAHGWTTLRFQRTNGKLFVIIDGEYAFGGIHMPWELDSLEWRPQLNTISIDYLRAWTAHRQLSDQEAHQSLFQTSQLELFDSCLSYVNSQQARVSLPEQPGVHGSASGRHHKRSNQHVHTSRPTSGRLDRSRPGTPENLLQTRQTPTMDQQLHTSRPTSGRLDRSRPGTPESLPQTRQTPTMDQHLHTSRPTSGRLDRSRPGTPENLPQTRQNLPWTRQTSEVTDLNPGKCWTRQTSEVTDPNPGQERWQSFASEGRYVDVDASEGMVYVSEDAGLSEYQYMPASERKPKLQEEPNAQEEQTSLYTGLSTAMSSIGQDTWCVNTAQGGTSSRNAATILNSLSNRRTPPADDEALHLHPDVSYAVHQ